MQIRKATADDIPRIVEMATRFINETPYRAHTTVNVEQLETLASFLIETGAGVILLAERDGGQVVGMLALSCLPHPLTGEPYGDELVWWVDPEHRKSAAGWRLLCAAEDYCLHMGLSVLKMVAPSGSNVGKVYDRRGYHPIETAYHKTFVQ